MDNNSRKKILESIESGEDAVKKIPSGIWIVLGIIGIWIRYIYYPTIEFLDPEVSPEKISYFKMAPPIIFLTFIIVVLIFILIKLKKIVIED